MTTVALIAEGITDQIVIENIIQELYEDELDVNYMQPARDATDEARTANFGGWELVLEYCSIPDRIQEALALNDYVIIQIDTDCGDSVRYGVPLTEGGKDRAYLDIINDTKFVLIDKMGKEFYEKNEERILFAIAVHSLECWIIVYLFDTVREKNCADHLNRELNKKNMNKLNKSEEDYKNISKLIKRKKLKKITNTNCSFGIFLKETQEKIKI